MTPVTPYRCRPWALVLAGLVVLGLLGGCNYLFPGGNGQGTPPSSRPPAPPGDEVAIQVHNFCGSACHAYPPPDTFPRKYWRSEVERGFRFFEQSALPIKPPPVESVVAYYEQRAPEDLAVPDLKPASAPLSIKFEKVSYPGPPVSDRYTISNVNLVRLPPPGKAAPAGLDILACEMKEGLVMLLRPYEPSPTWKVLARVPNPSHTEVLDLDGDGLLDILVADLGSFPPTDRRCGSVVWLRGQSDGSFKPITLLKQVGRVADVQAADFRGVGKLDLVVAVFGWHQTGEVLYLENHTTDWDRPEFTPRVLDGRHGAIHVPVADLNEDGKPDFVALFGQEHEAVVAFINEGGGKFRTEDLFKGPHPGYGSSGIQLVDVNRDGKLDVLYSNGDILDEPYLFKPYHGVQWLENKGDLHFEHHPLAAMYGVHRAVAADLRGSGLMDVLAVSFLPIDKFPDRGKRKADAIIVLEQTTPGRWERHSLGSIDGDHTTCAVGDLFGSGRLDLVVGHFSSQSTDHPVTIFRRLQ